MLLESPIPPNSLQIRLNSFAGIVHSDVKLSSGMPSCSVSMRIRVRENSDTLSESELKISSTFGLEIEVEG